VSVVCCQAEVSATDWSLVQRSPTDCGASLCVTKKPRMRGGYSPARGLQNSNPQWVVAPVGVGASLPIIYPVYSSNFMLHNFHIFGPIRKALKGYAVTPDDNMQEVWYRGLGRSPKNSLQSRYADLCASRGFLSKCLWWIFLIVAIPSPVSILKNVLCVYASHYVHDQLQTV